ncbi:hypothetical protein GA830_14970 [Mesorhizobium sp. NBSH29]|uniref:Pr6Pr family membrane protein n=1 Tax=Mesorhizobium sp. NBSH29 TaxID=2654249 RepID=UPI0018969E2C|nr:Pr6Pr family membrane protein [Mesorhizobium sp. NBSH29]QPC87904.1 hypothetical protein GA830_14970 [Mesorhizobium sp. NBSH29]
MPDRRKILPWAGLAIGLAAIALQFSISIPASMAAGRSLGGSIIWFFSYFTILTNIAAVLVYARTVTGEKSLRPALFASPAMRAGVAVAITVVFLVYAIVLSQQWQPQGLFYLCDILLHYVTPVLYVVWWLCYGTDGRTRWKHLLAFGGAPLIYLVYVLARAPYAGEVPYPFLDASIGGWPSVIIAAAGISCLFIILGVVAILADHGIARMQRRGSTA